MIVANAEFNNTVLASVYKHKHEDQKSEVPTYTYSLMFGDIVIDALPKQIIIYDNPIDKTRKYEITFVTNSAKRKLFVVGPASLESITDELQLRNKILKRQCLIVCLQ